VSLVLAWAVGIGWVAVLRSLLAPAAVARAAHLGWLHLQGTALSFMGSKVALIIFSLLAIGELIGDKLPKTPRRTAVAPLIARMITGGLCGACIFVSSSQSLAIGAVPGAVGAVAGAFAGYEIRKRLVTQLKVPDLFIALPEDLIAISLALFLVSR